MRKTPLLTLLLLCATAGAAPASDSRPVSLPFKDLHGNKVQLKDLRGKPVLLNFWATWCVPCRSEMPMLVEQQKQYGPQGVAFVAISLDDRQTRPKIPAFLEEFHIGFPVWTAGSTMDLDDLKLGQALPATAFLDSQGRIVARVLGEITKDEVVERIEWLLGTSHAEPSPLVRHLNGN